MVTLQIVPRGTFFWLPGQDGGGYYCYLIDHCDVGRPGVIRLERPQSILLWPDHGHFVEPDLIAKMFHVEHFSRNGGKPKIAGTAKGVSSGPTAPKDPPIKP